MRSNALFSNIKIYFPKYLLVLNSNLQDFVSDFFVKFSENYIAMGKKKCRCYKQKTYEKISIFFK